MDPVAERLAANIRELADERGLALSVLADLAGVARGHFFRVMGGRASPTVEWLVKVAAALQVDVSVLLAPPSRVP